MQAYQIKTKEKQNKTNAQMTSFHLQKKEKKKKKLIISCKDTAESQKAVCALTFLMYVRIK